MVINPIILLIFNFFNGKILIFNFYRMFVTWVPEIFCDSNYSMFQIARIRNTILFNISSVHNITSSLCLSISDIRRLRQVLTCDLPDPIVDSLIGSRTAESYCNGVAELALPRTPLERLELLNVSEFSSC